MISMGIMAKQKKGLFIQQKNVLFNHTIISFSLFGNHVPCKIKIYKTFGKENVLFVKKDVFVIIMIISYLISSFNVIFLFCIKNTKPNISHFQMKKQSLKRFLYNNLISLINIFNQHYFFNTPSDIAATDSIKILFLPFFFLFLMEYYNINAFKNR